MMNAYKYGPRVFVSTKQGMILTMWIKLLMLNMERNHLITAQCGKPLTYARETTNNENGPQDTVVHPNACE